MHQNARLAQTVYLDYTWEPVEYDEWDARKIYGCKCDRGYSGYDCSLRTCPHGDDPLTQGTNDVQEITCFGNGFVHFQFKGETSKPVSSGATVDQIKRALESMNAIDEVEVKMLKGGTMCGPDAFNPEVTTLSFHRPAYRLPLLGLKRDDNVKASVVKIQVGTKEDAACSGRGICKEETGLCDCNFVYASSDGHEGVGKRADCGYIDDNPWESPPVKIDLVRYERSPKGRITSCPSQIEALPCTGKGACSTDGTFTCACGEGWMGSDCSQRKCPEGFAWFDTPYAANIAHQRAECSNAGTCDRGRGNASVGRVLLVAHANGWAVR